MFHGISVVELVILSSTEMQLSYRDVEPQISQDGDRMLQRATNEPDQQNRPTFEKSKKNDMSSRHDSTVLTLKISGPVQIWI